VVISLACTAVVAACGPSAAVEPLVGRPPFGWHAGRGPTLVTLLLAVAVIAGAGGLTGLLRAERGGWRFDVRRVFLASAAVAIGLALMAPVGSTDPGSYAAYGRLAATGHSPYVVAPSTLTGSYGAAVEAPWRDTPTIYGPLATGEQRLAAEIAGGGPNAATHAVFLLDLAGAVAFLVTGLLLLRGAAEEAARRRAVLMYSANPLLLLTGVAGGHLDVLVALFVVAAVTVARRQRTVGLLVAGVLAGAAIAIKASAALVGLALAWCSFRGRRPVPVVALALGAAVVLVPGYLLVGRHGFDQLGRASGFVSFADPWRLVTDPLQWLFGHGAARDVIRTLAWLFAGLLAIALARGLPGHRDDPGGGAGAPRAAAVVLLAWLLTAPYVLPWYAVPVWALLALLPASGYDRLLGYWTAILALAYLPGRQVTPTGPLHAVLTGWKSGFAPVLLLGVAVGAFALSLRRRA
jgi:hypothetical protein